jgi:hypothetical protein
MKTKVTPNQIIRKIKEKKSDPRLNITFRLPASLKRDFDAKCKTNDVSMNEVIEELVKAFIES